MIGDYKANNSAFKKTEKIFDLARPCEQREEFYLTILNTSTSPSALITCCAHMLKLDVMPDVARKKLEEIADNSEKSFRRFEAKMFLSE